MTRFSFARVLQWGRGGLPETPLAGPSANVLGAGGESVVPVELAPWLTLDTFCDRVLLPDFEGQAALPTLVRRNLQRVVLAPEVEAALARERGLEDFARGELIYADPTENVGPGALGLRRRLTPEEVVLLSGGPLSGGKYTGLLKAAHNLEVINLAHAMDLEWVTAPDTVKPIGSDGFFDTSVLRRQLSDQIAVMENEEIVALLEQLVRRSFGNRAQVELVNELVVIDRTGTDGEQIFYNFQPRLNVCVGIHRVGIGGTVGSGLLSHLCDGVSLNIYKDERAGRAPSIHFIANAGIVPKPLNIIHFDVAWDQR